MEASLPARRHVTQVVVIAVTESLTEHLCGWPARPVPVHYLGVDEWDGGSSQS